MKYIKRIVVSLLIVSALSFGVGHITGNYISASSCEEETSDNKLISFISNLSTNKAFANCKNDVYMGAKWVTKRAPVNLSNLDNSIIKNRMRDAISHFNSTQSYIDIVEDSSNGSYGYIYATDGYYYFESWTAKADGSWYGGWPINNYYENEHPINIKFNLDIYFDGTYDQERATARHELGHSVGLGHRSDAYTLMYCSRNGRKVYGLTSGDKEALNVIY